MTDRITVRSVVWGLTAITLGIIIVVFLLARASVAVPDELLVLGGTTAGALSGLLARTGTSP